MSSDKLKYFVKTEKLSHDNLIEKPVGQDKS